MQSDSTGNLDVDLSLACVSLRKLAKTVKMVPSQESITTTHFLGPTHKCAEL